MPAVPVDPPRHGVPVPRLVLGVLVLPLALILGAVAWAASVRARLPQPIATHWSAGGEVNGTMALGELLVFTSAMAVVLWAPGVLAVIAGHRSRVRYRTERTAMAWCCTTTAFNSSVVVLTVQANVDRAVAASARLPAIAIVAVLLFTALVGTIGWALAGRPPILPAVTIPAGAGRDHDAGDPATSEHAGATVGRVPPVPAIELAAHEHPVWQRPLTAWWLAAVAAPFAVLGAGLLLVNPAFAIGALLAGVVIGGMCTITVVIDGTGLSVRFGPLGWPRKHVDLAAIDQVRAEDIEPLEWGGWGYRVVPGRTAVVLRRGPAIVLHLRTGREFAVTIDDPERGAALLDAYRRRAASTHSGNHPTA